ncbi:MULTISPECIES: 4-amino-4-deoxy-L-arabinose-phosphoundecaprenol flippase subunit ArnE [Enterobacteriaceae]|jgi:undecaprenyl phosphate-alpha-L-ara4N flippase subunit ArnE|uniref:Probable 4-amino-4-deoxy-L-arabinose-phosphoundecaprenol flippase subunit ArnE n=1 Tax=Buttiauxella ferragutiae ATCC 51602 TaxID=1354252 RepID=A0ABX2W628_9ENTR|nr:MULTISPECIES: 4-amino-4-deoxy-L-arabinose-phosphoundecaprenol flippase subunit ArnE [Buttiauxella]AYN26266.1 4-amino-4-deoxy-L-arabinose-phosphoundecaprenol flippase subunit ArnE [Buttiauxella sp. 3AFRM03]OAT26277.1 polymyxin resistance sucrose-6 phosphate hydrolase [Buttiauxella ferragutiae ATCC 51602]TDN54537.1 undecaprenyl phosphate-alpha-L-ara4N flippase subunit ArnE [Buttiauxella sp. JUb87]UNK63431.1 4-amino-4-deoxy-L-arabinose-phosphoundecaprenol flippase subunit ArnE [Buttiauxella fer
MSYLLIVLASLLSCGGQLCQKQATYKRGRLHLLGWLALSVLLLGCAMLLWLLVLQRVPVSVAYPMLSLNFIFITLAARFIWHEPVSLRHWLGVVVIICGISILGGAA